ncbi:MAG: DUF1365 domain-containing protein [Hyphomicrobium sp.]
MMSAGAAYTGTVVHKRLRPRPHALSYRVFSLLLDVDRIDECAARLWCFNRNRFGLLSFHDRDHGKGDGTPVAEQAREVLARAGIDTGGGRILLLAYPRVLGYVFNPLSVYYAFDAGDRLAALIYEVNNTFGERKSYVVRAGTNRDGVFAQSSPKQMYVSPFAAGSGRYGFRVTEPGESLLVGVQFRDPDGPLLKTHFAGRAEPLTDRTLAGLMLRFPLMTLKVITAIHVEALKLWLKGVPLSERHRSPAYSVTHAEVEGET